MCESFVCEYDDLAPTGPCENWGDCIGAGECLLSRAMSDTSWADDYADAYNRELEEEALGRPLFPNEY